MQVNPSAVRDKGSTGAFGFLRQLLRRESVSERCELCGTGLASTHEHGLALPSRQLLCLCKACAILTPEGPEGRYRCIPRRIQFLPDFRMTEWQWDRLQIPVALAFFYRNSTIGKVAAGYPSPAGLIESLIEQEAWEALIADNPSLEAMTPDVEALLVNRIGSRNEYFILPMDHCFRLIGLMRARWHGLSGGDDAHKEMEEFFAWLKEHTDA
jgi:hypothetical protein